MTTPALHPVVRDVTDRIRVRSAETRRRYLERIGRAARRRPARLDLGCANLAHGFAACESSAKDDLRGDVKPNVAIVSSYNDMLSAHQPYETFPRAIKEAVAAAGAVAQFAGGVPAMCDGVTQGHAGMELSLFSRDVIAMATAVALSHEMFDGALLLGICDKIVPGLLIGGLAFGHLPVVLVPGGPMTSGLPNSEKSRVRQLYAEDKVGRAELLAAESASYHGPGTCTFYGTANSNQMIVEIMGLHLPGASFVNPGTPLRAALTAAAARRVTELTATGPAYTPMGQIVDEKAVVNAVVGLHATGGSTNHTLHLVAVAAAAGIQLSWDDFSDLSEVVPLLARVYPNGNADVNHFQAAGGMAFVIGQLLDGGLLHGDVRTVAGAGLNRYRQEPFLGADGSLVWRPGPAESLDPAVLRPISDPFTADGGLCVLRGNLGRAVIKVSAVAPSHRVVTAPARVFDDQAHVVQAFASGELDRDVVVVVRYQGPRANGMPELHKLTPLLGVLQDRGHRVALVTDGRMSGASGKIPAAIHLTPECAVGGPLTRVRDGDVIGLDSEAGTLHVELSDAELLTRAGSGAPASDDDWVVPFAVEVVAGQDAFGFKVFHLLVGDLDACGIGRPVEFGVHGQPGVGGGRGDGLDDHFVAGQWSAAPVHRDVGEQSMLDLVPLAGARRQVAHGDGQAGGGGELGQFGLPLPGAVPVGASAVCADQQSGSIEVPRVSGLMPPGSDGVHRERRRVVVGAHRHPPDVGAHVVDPVRVGLAQRGVDEIVDLDRLRLARRLPLPATVLVGPDQLLLLGVDTDHRVPRTPGGRWPDR